MDLETLLEKIKSEGYKITKTRKAILQILIDSNKKMLSVDNLLKESKKLGNNINITTIYRNLDILESLNLVHKILSSNGIFLYKLLCHFEHHHHLICLNCGLIVSIDFCPLRKYLEISKEKKFQLTDHKLELYGLCKKCIPFENT